MITITGGRGFVGSNLVKCLSENEPVLSVVSGRTLMDTSHGLEIGLEHENLPDLIRKTSVFIHTAGKVRGLPDELQRANVASTQRYIQLLPETVEHVIHFSSVNVYFAEINPYGRTKLLGEERWAASPFSNRLTILRPALIYGPGDEKHIYRLIHLVRRLPVLPIPSGSPLRPVYLQDVVELAAALVRKQEAKGKTWVVSGREEISYVDLVRLIASQLGKRIWVLSLPVSLLTVFGKLAEVFSLANLVQQLRSLQVARTWHDAAVWEYLPRELIPLEEGLRRSIAGYFRNESFGGSF